MSSKQERDLKLLARIASYMYGERWQSDLARDLDLNERTVRGWVQGRAGITPTIWRQVYDLLEHKIKSAGPVMNAAQKRIDAIPAE